MKTVPLVLIAVVLAALAAWLLLSGGAPGPSPEDDVAVRPDAPPEAPPEEATTSPTIEGAPRRPAPPAKPPPRPVPAKPVLETGSVLVVPLTIEGGEAPPALRIELEAFSATPHAPSLAVPVEGGRYRVDRVPVGKYRVRASGDLLLDATADVAVEAGAEARVELRLEPGGMAAFRAVLYHGELPESVTVEVRDGRGLPVPARFFSRMRGHEATARTGTSATLPAEGVISNLKPGRYVARATSVRGEYDEQPLEIRAGQTSEVAFRISK
jgi:hypothetical protein